MKEITNTNSNIISNRNVKGHLKTETEKGSYKSKTKTNRNVTDISKSTFEGNKNRIVKEIYNRHSRETKHLVNLETWKLGNVGSKKLGNKFVF